MTVPIPSALRSIAVRSLARLDRRWTQAEIACVTAVIALEAGVLCVWVLLRGLSTPAGSEGMAGLFVRALVGLTLLGTASARLTRDRSVQVRRVATTLAVVTGVLLAPLWRTVGIDYASNVLNWLQQSSSLTLFGGLRGIGTRLTLVLGLVGASLAAGWGKHVTIDLVTRWSAPSARRALDGTSACASAAICFVVAWGFFDHLSIEHFHAPPGSPAAVKARHVAHGVAEHGFALRRQLELDARSLRPVLVEARPYAGWLDGATWNAWVNASGFVERYGAEAARALRTAPHETRAPMIAIPRVGEPRGDLVHSADLAMPFGLWIIGLRMLLRAVRVALDPEEVARERHAGAEVAL